MPTHEWEARNSSHRPLGHYVTEARTLLNFTNWHFKKGLLNEDSPDLVHALFWSLAAVTLALRDGLGRSLADLKAQTDQKQFDRTFPGSCRPKSVSFAFRVANLLMLYYARTAPSCFR
jgi:hypothetical protein